MSRCHYYHVIIVLGIVVSWLVGWHLWDLVMLLSGSFMLALVIDVIVIYLVMLLFLMAAKSYRCP